MWTLLSAPSMHMKGHFAHGIFADGIAGVGEHQLYIAHCCAGVSGVRFLDLTLIDSTLTSLRTGFADARMHSASPPQTSHCRGRSARGGSKSLQNACFAKETGFGYLASNTGPSFESTGKIVKINLESWAVAA